MRTISYEGIAIETCDACGGAWLDAGELGKIVEVRALRFDPAVQRAIAAAARIPGIPMEEIERELTCPACGAELMPHNYGTDTGVVIDRCPGCHGIWVDKDELEKIQMLVEGWDDLLPKDLAVYGPTLHDIEVAVDAADDVEISRLPRVGRFVNAAINGVLDVLT